MANRKLKLEEKTPLDMVLDQINERFETLDEKQAELLLELKSLRDLIQSGYVTKGELKVVNDKVNEIRVNISRVVWLVVSAVILAVLGTIMINQ